MKFTVNDKTYFVKWEYPTIEPVVYKYTTVCKIYDTNSSYSEPLVEGYATLAVGDRFCKNTGRKISLNRALNVLFPNYSFIMNEPLNIKEHSAKARAIAWAEYFNESPKRLK